jgi:ribonuclease HI
MSGDPLQKGTGYAFLLYRDFMRLRNQGAMGIHQVEYIKVKGHCDNELNNHCDFPAREAIKRLS